MKKPSFEAFCEFRDEFEKISGEAGKEQYLVPYFISSFPGTTDEKMEQVFDWLQDEGWRLQHEPEHEEILMEYRARKRRRQAQAAAEQKPGLRTEKQKGSKPDFSTYGYGKGSGS